jgi:hypothetical protein
MNGSQILVATSISPKRIKQQNAALQTWLDRGFKVISLNTEDEIILLKEQVLGIELITVNRDARQYFRKPLVYIVDILRYLQDNGSTIVGIINSDIYLKEKNYFAEEIKNLSKNSVVLASRKNISSLNDVEGKIYNYGFDAFFIDQKLLHFFPDSQYCLGIPWWDYWLPLIAMKKGLTLKLLKNKKLYHIEHDINYSMEAWRKMGIEFAEEFIPGMREELMRILKSDIYQLDEYLGKFMTNSFLDLLVTKSDNI